MMIMNMELVGMGTEASRRRWRSTSCMVVGALLLSATAIPALAQTQGPAGPPQGPAGSGPPPGFPPGGPPGGPGGPPMGPPLTPAQQIVAALPASPAPDLAGAAIPPGLFAPGPFGSNVEMPTADPRDLQGTWTHNQPLEFRMQRDMYGRPLPYNMAGARVIARRVQSLVDGTPFINASASCRPAGPQWQLDLNFPFQVFQSEDAVEFVFLEYHGRWQIALKPDAKPAGPAREYMGRSVGSWDGTTLVVESRDFKQALWLDVDGTPLSADGRLIQRIRKVDNGDRQPYLEIVTTIIDPLYYEHPWSVVRTFGWRPDLVVFNEYNCEIQTGAPGASADSGLIPEPQD